MTRPHVCRRPAGPGGPGRPGSPASAPPCWSRAAGGRLRHRQPGRCLAARRPAAGRCRACRRSGSSPRPAGRGTAGAMRMLTTQGGLRWGPMPPGAVQPQGDPQWTVDSMARRDLHLYLRAHRQLPGVGRRPRHHASRRRPGPAPLRHRRPAALAAGARPVEAGQPPVRPVPQPRPAAGAWPRPRRRPGRRRCLDPCSAAAPAGS